MNLNKLDLIKETMKLWERSYCEPTTGWPGTWTIIWRCEKYHGKISTSYKSKNKPSDKKINELLIKELNERLNISKLQCSAQSVAFEHLRQPYIDLINEYKVKLIGIIINSPQKIKINTNDFSTEFSVNTQKQGDEFLSLLDDITVAEVIIDKIRSHVYKNTLRA